MKYIFRNDKYGGKKQEKYWLKLFINKNQIAFVYLFSNDVNRKNVENFIIFSMNTRSRHVVLKSNINRDWSHLSGYASLWSISYFLSRRPSNRFRMWHKMKNIWSKAKYETLNLSLVLWIQNWFCSLLNVLYLWKEYEKYPFYVVKTMRFNLLRINFEKKQLYVHTFIGNEFYSSLAADEQIHTESMKRTVSIPVLNEWIERVIAYWLITL